MALRAAPEPTDAELDRLGQVMLQLQARGRLEAWLAGLPPEDVHVARQALARVTGSGWRASPATFGRRLLPAGTFEPYPYVQLLSDKFTQLEDGTDPFQIWTVPAQYGKSTMGQVGLGWALDRSPHKRYITASYGDDLADRNALAVRDLLAADGTASGGEPVELNPMAQLRRDARRKDRFQTLAGGGLLAAGIGGGITGFGAHGVLVDDPFKNWQEAHSAARRQAVWNWFRSVAFLRRTTSTAWVLIVMTRWHDDDLVARLLKAAEGGEFPPFTLTRLAEVAETPDPTASDPAVRQPDPLGREPGQVLEPRRFTPEAVRTKMRVLGSYLWAGMAQGRPAPEEGNEVKRAWFKHGATLPRHADQWLTSWDMKLKDKESGDYVVGQVWARTGSRYWLLDQLRGQWNQATTANAMALATVRWPQARQHLVENTGYGPELMETLRTPMPDYVVPDDTAAALGMNDTERAQVQELRRRGLGGLVPITPKGPKPVRARAISPYIEAGDVWLPEGAAWVPGYLDEWASFPNGAHDDQVDTTSQALAVLARPFAVTETPTEATADNPAPVPTRTARSSVSGPARRRMR